MPVTLSQYREAVEIFNNRLFVRALKYNNFSLISHSQDNCFLDCDFHHNDIRFTFFLIFLMLLTLKRKTCKSTIYFSVLSFLTIAVNVSIATWVSSILTSLSGDFQLNPGPKNKSDVTFSIFHWNLNSIAAKKFDWQRAFLNTSVNEKVAIFNNTVLNILSNFIPHETIVCDDKDPPWFKNKIKTLIQAKNAAFNSFLKNSGNSELKFPRTRKSFH